VLQAHVVAAVREAEADLMATLPPGALMARAAYGLATQAAQLLREGTGGIYGRRLLVLAGGGDNGGDALHAAAHLARRGVAVEVLPTTDDLHAQGLAALRRAGGTLLEQDPTPGRWAQVDLVLDGILGIGGRPGLRGRADRLAKTLDELPPRHRPLVLAVDLPSGVEVDSGRLDGPSVRADVTVTFGTHKPALWLDPAAGRAGSVRLVDIGLRPHLGPPALEMLTDDDAAALLPSPGRGSDKYARGVLGLVAGSPAYSGAAVLAAGGAVHGGAGMVRVVDPAAAATSSAAGTVADAVRARWPEVVAADGRVQAWVVGPGLDQHRAVVVVPTVLQRARDEGVAVLLDAGALDATLLDRCRHLLGPHVLLTPHAGELARLLRLQRAQVEDRRWASARTAATRWGVVVLLKGATTVVVGPQAPARVNGTGVAWLATAGSGDVLAGLVGAFLAGGLPPLDAGALAAHVHGRAGALAASRAGAPSAQTVLDALPAALRRLRIGEDGTP